MSKRSTGRRKQVKSVQRKQSFYEMLEPRVLLSTYLFADQGSRDGKRHSAAKRHQRRHNHLHEPQW